LEATPWKVPFKCLGRGGRASLQETSYRLEVLVAPERLREARELFTRLGKQLGQRAIYFEVREGGEIIDLD